MTTMTAELATIDAVEARALTDQIKTGVEAVWHLVTRAYTEGAWRALGYNTWDVYCEREFGTSRLRLPREERTDVVMSMRDAGLSIRAIAAATGDSHMTIQREVAGVPNVTPDEPVDADALAEELIAGKGCASVKRRDCANWWADLLAQRAPEPPGAPTESTPGQTDRVAEALAKAKKAQTAPEPKPIIGIDGKKYARKSKPKPVTELDPQPEPAAPEGEKLGQGVAEPMTPQEAEALQERIQVVFAGAVEKAAEIGISRQAVVHLLQLEGDITNDTVAGQLNQIDSLHGDLGSLVAAFGSSDELRFAAAGLLQTAIFALIDVSEMAKAATMEASIG